MNEINQRIMSLTRKKMEESGEYNREAFREFIEESIEYYLEKGELSQDDNLDAIQEELMGMYSEVESEEAEDIEIDEEEEDDTESLEELGDKERENEVEPLEDEEKF